MKKDNILKYLIIAIALILVILMVIVIILNIKKSENNSSIDDEEFESPELEVDESIEEIEQINTYCMVENIINENIMSGNIFYTNKIYFQENLDIDGYRLYVLGEIFDKVNRKDQNVFYAIDFNSMEGSYKISQIKQDIKIDEFEQIAKSGAQKYLINENITGEFFQDDITENNIVRRYFEYYKMLILINPEKAYSLINDEYKSLRFGNYDNFNQYVNNNITKFSNMEFSKFKIIYYDDYTQYISLSSYGEYYIFNSKNIMNFSVLLDQYMVDIPQFTEKYEKSDVRIKVGLNVNKFILGINNKNYNYALSLLADSFKKANNLTNASELEKYVSNYFFDQNEIEFLTFNEQGSYYIYNANLKNKDTEEIKSIKIVMQLEEGTKFKMSFSF